MEQGQQRGERKQQGKEQIPALLSIFRVLSKHNEKFAKSKNLIVLAFGTWL